MKSNRVGITSTGSYLPSFILSSSELESRLGLVPGFIEEKTGILGRGIADESETASYMGYRAAKAAIESKGIATDAIDYIICCTYTADYTYPALACKIAQLLGSDGVGTFDLMANCTGFQVGLNVASDKLVADSTINNVLVVAVANQHNYIDWTDPNTSIYFGDGASAAILERVSEGFGFLGHTVKSVTASYDAVRVRDGGSQFPLTAENLGSHTNFVEMNGLEVWKQVVINMPKILQETATKSGIEIGDIDFFIFHQANLKLIEYVMKRMKVPISKTCITVDRFGNTADASIGISLDEAVRQGKIKNGDVVAFLGVGAGFIFGCSIIRWG